MRHPWYTDIPQLPSVWTTVNSNSASWAGGGGGGGNSAYSTTIGNGTDTSFVVTHNLGTTSVVVQVHDVNTTEVVYPMIQTTSANTTTLLFDVVPTVNQFQVVVLAAGGGGGGGEIAASIPAPVLKFIRDSTFLLGKCPKLYVSYVPTLTASWLSPQTEVWLFAYRMKKTKRWTKWPANTTKHVNGYVHTVDSTRWVANSGKPLYAGNPGGGNGLNKTFHTEFSFTSAGQLPLPYQQIPLSAFNPLQFYRDRTNNTLQVQASAFPFNKVDGKYGITLPRMSGGDAASKTGKNLKLYLAFAFAIPNPDATSKYPKIFGPFSYLTVSAKWESSNVSGRILFMTYATKQSK